MKTLAEVLAEIAEWMEEAERILKQDPPFTLRRLLEDIEGEMDRILWPGREPRLKPEFAGRIDVDIDIDGLDSCLATACKLIRRARDEAERGAECDYEVIGGALKTVKYRLLPRFRIGAGIRINRVTPTRFR